MTDICEFCCSYNASTYADKEWRKIQIKHGEKPLYHDLTVAIVERTYHKGRKKSASTTEYYRYGKVGYKLNFCPECGIKLKGAI